jgi:hypothetical protein
VKPGDLIEWAWRHTANPVRRDETLWSSVDGKWVPVGSELTHLCVNCDEEEKTIMWLNERGVFRARADDGSVFSMPWSSYSVVPRSRG